ncbi:MAG: L-fuconolactonase [Pseudonocardiales bacterium]|jgi:L-fuconolactonase|nr:L-fuconolactonase [Jatrophihabitans sp.]MDT4931323.1 L-fuconolactonase [Pseudonocardiales bacterium]
MPSRVDAHHHLWDLGVREQPWTAELPALRRSFGLAELKPQLASTGIGATVVVETINVAAETPELLALSAVEPVIAGVVGWVQLTRADVASRVTELRAGPGGDRLVGLRHQVQGEPDPDWLDRTDVRTGLAAVADLGLTFDLLVRSDQLPAAVRLARSLPELRFVLDHAGKPHIARGDVEPWRTHVAELARSPNVAVKLSGLVTEAAPDWTVETLVPYARVLLDAFSPNRILFGSDWPVCLLAAGYQRVAQVAAELIEHLSPDEQADVFGANAVHWYGLTSEDRV